MTPFVAGLSCPDGEYLVGFDASGALICNTFPKYYSIGDTGPGGGIVFYVPDGGLHGLEAAPGDQVSAPWCSSFVDIAGVDNIGSAATPDSHSGAHNTPLIEAVCGAASAAGIAAAYVWPWSDGRLLAEQGRAGFDVLESRSQDWAVLPLPSTGVPRRSTSPTRGSRASSMASRSSTARTARAGCVLFGLFNYLSI